MFCDSSKCILHCRRYNASLSFSQAVLFTVPLGYLRFTVHRRSLHILSTTIYRLTIMVELLALLTCFAVAISAQESPNQNQSDTLINALIYLPLYTVSGSGNGVLNQTFCDAYAPKNATQYAFITKLVERAFIGDYTPNTNQSVYQAQGILNSSAYYRDPTGNVNSVNLLPYFNGALKSTNRAGVRLASLHTEAIS